MTGERGGPGSASPDHEADAAIADTMLALIAARATGATICPSDVARSLHPDDAARWRALMPRVRAVAATLAGEGRIVATRPGVVVDATSPGGPIRLGRPTPVATDPRPIRGR